MDNCKKYRIKGFCVKNDVDCLIEIDAEICANSARIDFITPDELFMLYRKNNEIQQWFDGEIETLFCVDENNESITLFNVKFYINRTNSLLLWNNMIVGEKHLISLDIKASSLTVLYQDKISAYTCTIGHHSYTIENGKIMVDAKRVNGGVLFSLENKGDLSLGEIQIAHNHLMEIYFLYIGYFADVKETTLIFEGIKFLYFTSSNGLNCTKKSEVNINKWLNPNTKDFSEAYQHWLDKKSGEGKNRDVMRGNIVINLFKHTQEVEGMIAELPIFHCIACLEGYLSLTRPKVLELDETVKKIKDKILRVVKSFTKASSYKSLFDNLPKDSKYKAKTLREKLLNATGNAFLPTLEDKLKYAINYADPDNIVFKTELENNTFDDFILKAKKHRNMFAHSDLKDEWFGFREVKYAYRKFALIFRLMALKDIGLTPQKDSIESNVWWIEDSK